MACHKLFQHTSPPPSLTPCPTQSSTPLLPRLYAADSPTVHPVRMAWLCMELMHEGGGMLFSQQGSSKLLFVQLSALLPGFGGGGADASSSSPSGVFLFGSHPGGLGCRERQAAGSTVQPPRGHLQAAICAAASATTGFWMRRGGCVIIVMLPGVPLVAATQVGQCKGAGRRGQGAQFS